MNIDLQINSKWKLMNFTSKLISSECIQFFVEERLKNKGQLDLRVTL